MENPAQKIHDLLEKFDTAMLVTHGRDQFLHARPMGIAKVEPNCDVWFFTARSSEKAREIEQEQEVILVFQNDHKRYLSLSGRAKLVSDHAQIAALWKESYKVWFPEGIKDPNLSFIRVNVAEAEYWDSSGFKGVKYLFAAAKAYVTGEPPKTDPDQHGRVVLK